MAISSLDLYRIVIPAAGHAALPDATVEQFLELSAQQHTASVFGVNYQLAMVYHAAHVIDVTVPAAGGYAASAAASGLSGPATSVKTGDLAVSAAGPSSGSGAGANQTADDSYYALTTYGQRYLQIRNTRSGVLPDTITVLS